MEPTRRRVAQFRHPCADEIAVGIEAFRLCDHGFWMRKYGAASAPVPALHCQPPLLLAISPSTSLRMKNASPSRQWIRRSLVRNMDVIMRSRLCMKPSAESWRIPASTMGNPVRPSHHRAKSSAWSAARRQGSPRMAGLYSSSSTFGKW